VQRAPGIPNALCFLGRKIHQRLGRIAPRGRECMSGLVVIAIHTFLAARWIASRRLSSGAHSRDPVGSQCCLKIVIYTLGSDAQKKKFLPRILTHEKLWSI
jgi:alkylation response protein AidB-like acyl-CoA dehydrogenase